MNIDLLHNRVSVREAYIMREVARLSSIRNAARSLNMEAAVISRILSDLEKKVGFKFFSRSHIGVHITPVGKKILSIFSNFLDKLESLNSEKKLQRELKICATSFLHTYVSSKCIVPFLLSKNILPYLIDASPDQLILFSTRNAFEAAIHFNILQWPNTWTQRKVGKVSWVLCVKKTSRIPKDCSLEQIKKLDFIYPIDYLDSGLYFGNDFFPLLRSQRTIKLYTSTADSALMNVTNSSMAAFLPRVLAEVYLDKVKILSPKFIPPVSKTLYLSVKSDLVSNEIFETLSKKLKGFCY